MAKIIQRKRRWIHKCDRAPDPTRLDIQRRAALVRAGWTDATRLKRAGLDPDDPLHYEIPRVVFTARTRP